MAFVVLQFAKKNLDILLADEERKMWEIVGANGLSYLVAPLPES
jgi:ligand-binding sensor domain-containing protein